MSQIIIEAKGLEKFKEFMFNEEYDETQEAFITVDGQIASSLGNLLVIFGPAKSGKSAVAGAIIAGSINPTQVSEDGEEVETVGLTVSPNIDSHAVIYFNSELSTRDFHRYVRRIVKRSGLTSVPAHFHAANFVTCSPSETLINTKEVVHEVSKLSAIRLIVVDGIGDYVSSVNDEKESNEVVSTFQKMADKYNCVVATIIHQNVGKNGGKARGHLGSQCERKTEGMIELTPKANYVQLKGKQFRNGPCFSPRRLKYDSVKEDFILLQENSKGLLEEVPQVGGMSRKAELSPESIKGIFGADEKLTHTILVNRLMEAMKRKVKTAKNKVKELAANGIIVKNVDSSYSLK
jgi:archaellum biogenesis ATPase FlaH